MTAPARLMAFAPVALFIYRRPEHTRRAIETLLACPELAQTQLYIFSDGPKTPDAAAHVDATRRVARELAPPSTVFVEHERNQGLAKSIIAGVTELTERHGRVIVIEDDLEVAPAFLRFMNLALDRYAEDDAVMQVSGYQFPLQPPAAAQSLMLAFATSWGWATWARAWKHFDAEAKGYARLAKDRALRRRFDLDGSYPYFKMLEQQIRGEVDSWAIRWQLSVFLRDGLVLYPGRSLVRNNGFDGSGTHGAGGLAVEPVSDDTFSAPVFPPVVLDVDTQQRVFEFLASQPGRDRVRRLKDLGSRWTQAALDNRFVPAPLKSLGRGLLARAGLASDPGHQDLEIYWDPAMAAVLETWGTGNAWNEIQLLLLNACGKVVDIACGTGKVMTLLAPYPALEVHGFDISDFLIQKALDRGIPRDRLQVADATKTPYADDAFDYGYSIGSLEHFTEDGIRAFVGETYRITRRASFHMIPVSRADRDEGWMKTVQSFHNNSVAWWLERYRSAYQTVHVLESSWNDRISVGKWFVCVKEPP